MGTTPSWRYFLSMTNPSGKTWLSTSSKSTSTKATIWAVPKKEYEKVLDPVATNWEILNRRRGVPTVASLVTGKKTATLARTTMPHATMAMTNPTSLRVTPQKATKGPTSRDRSNQQHPSPLQGQRIFFNAKDLQLCNVCWYIFNCINKCFFQSLLILPITKSCSLLVGWTFPFSMTREL